MNKLKNFLNRSKFLFKDARISGDTSINLRFRLNFIMYFFLLMIIPILIIGFICFFQSKQVIEDNTSSLALDSAAQMSKNVDYYIKDLNNITQELVEDPNFIQTTYSMMKSQTALDSYKIIGGTIVFGNNQYLGLENSISSKNIGLRSIYLLYDKKIYKLCSNDNSIMLKNNYSSESWYTETVSKPGKPYLLGTGIRFFEDSSFQYVISTAACKSLFIAGKPAVFVFDFDYKLLEKLLTTKVSLNNLNNNLYVVDKNDLIMFNNNQGLLTTKLGYGLAGKGNGVSKVTEDGDSMYMVYYASPTYSWRIVNLIPVDKIIKGAFLSPGVLILIAIFCIVTVYLFSLIISSKLLKPFSALTHAVSGYEKSEFSMQGESRSHTPPNQNQENISNMDKLVHKIYSTQIRQKEAQLKSLQNQINPHFLYNTLESIRGAALYYGVDVIAEMSKCLSLFFRYSISDNILVSIKDEIQHLENYMAIQNFRHENKFELKYNIPETLYDYKILKLTLQPLVENAIKHGLEMKLGKGSITITAFNLDNIIKIQIQDNGTGIPLKKLEELKSLLDKNPNENINAGSSNVGVGVQNVNSRIKIYFGKKYGLKYSSSESGTTVEIDVPAVEP